MAPVERITTADAQLINERIIEFNASKVPFTQKEPFTNLGFSVRNESGVLIAGILAVLYCWKCLNIEALWVREDCRGRRFGTQLLTKLEDEARSMGCYLAHLDTFDFQAKAFYEKRGYVIFGRLDDCPPGRTRFYLKKSLIAS